MKRVIAVVLSTVFAHVAMAQPSDWKKASDKDAWDEPAVSPDPRIDIPKFTTLSAVRAGLGAGCSNQIVSKVRLEGAAENMRQNLGNP